MPYGPTSIELYFVDEAAAFAKMESIAWPNGSPTCPHCGYVEKIYPIRSNRERRIRQGLWKCGRCLRQFTVTLGTVFESTHVPLHLWFEALRLVAIRKTRIRGGALRNTLGVSAKTARLMRQRLLGAVRADVRERLSLVLDGVAIGLTDDFDPVVQIAATLLLRG